MFNFRAREISHMAKLKIETRREEEHFRNLRKCSWDDTEFPEEEATLGQRPFRFTILTDLF